MSKRTRLRKRRQAKRKALNFPSIDTHAHHSRERRDRPMAATPVPVIPKGLRWHIVRVEFHREARVQQRFAEAGIAHYCAATAELRVRRGRKHTVTRRMLPGLIFVGLHPADDLDHVLAVRDVVRPVLLDGAPVVIRETELRSFAEAIYQGHVTAAAIAFVPGQTVMVKDGPFATFPAVVIDIGKDRRIQAEVNVFGTHVPVHLDVDQLEAA